MILNKMITLDRKLSTIIMNNDFKKVFGTIGNNVLVKKVETYIKE